MKLMLAGKVTGSTWRDSIAPCWSNRRARWTVTEGGVLGIADYVGTYMCLPSMSQRDIFLECEAAVHTTDVLFVWVDQPDLSGTAFEIGMAHILNKPYVIAFPGEPDPDVWFWTIGARMVLSNITAEMAVRKTIERFI